MCRPRQLQNIALNNHLQMKTAYIIPGALALSLLLSLPGVAQSRWYWGTEFSGGIAAAVTMKGGSTDRASICDEFINPQYASVPGCTDPNPGSNSAFRTEFESAVGVLGNLSLGYEALSWLRLEVEYAAWHAQYDEAAFVATASGDALDKLSQEIFLAREWLGAFSSSGGFVNAYLDYKPVARTFGVYAGAGGGLATAAAGYTSLWVRNKDVDAILTGVGQPNEDEIRQNLAGTFSNGQATLRSVTPVVQLLFGVDRYLTDRLSVGLKARYVMYLDFQSEGDLVWDPLRSHVPNNRRDGSEPVHGIYGADFSAVTFGLQVKRRY